MIQETRTKEVTLLSQLENIDRDLEDGRARLAQLKGDLDLQEELINKKQAELLLVEEEKNKAKSHVEKRLAAFYRLGDIGFMNVTFSTSTLPELLNLKEYFSALIAYDQQLIQQYREKIQQLILTNDELKAEKESLVQFIVEVKNQEKELADFRIERYQLLTRINTEKKLYQRALEEMREASDNLTQKLGILRDELAETQARINKKNVSSKKRRPRDTSGFIAMKGRLNPPVQGAVTSTFGEDNKNKFGIDSFANGIVIKTLAGSEISAIYNGKVVYAGQLRGYGNLIIIDHGSQYYSLISQAAKLYKKEGEQVVTGEVIGIMSDQGGLLGEGLHFEIRNGTKPEDPIQWINMNLLSIRVTETDQPE
ncbi:MAG: peptidoglycan DD-metalloendopeptidase family protein [Proteobacteria bacterium]|nr:peptidoglycan DD-metalloendopeptidase family protein [Pseudomonadota bacterium]MBU1686821.1 peptidoglycan DD-metalloendopeptidase family protein [Pseudomonadota bacterium]